MAISKVNSKNTNAEDNKVNFASIDRKLREAVRLHNNAEVNLLERKWNLGLVFIDLKASCKSYKVNVKDHVKNLNLEGFSYETLNMCANIALTFEKSEFSERRQMTTREIYAMAKERLAENKQRIQAEKEEQARKGRAAEAGFDNIGDFITHLGKEEKKLIKKAEKVAKREGIDFVLSENTDVEERIAETEAFIQKDYSIEETEEETTVDSGETGVGEEETIEPTVTIEPVYVPNWESRKFKDKDMSASIVVKYDKGEFSSPLEAFEKLESLLSAKIASMKALLNNAPDIGAKKGAAAKKKVS